MLQLSNCLVVAPVLISQQNFQPPKPYWIFPTAALLTCLGGKNGSFILTVFAKSGPVQYLHILPASVRPDPLSATAAIRDTFCSHLLAKMYDLQVCMLKAQQRS